MCSIFSLDLGHLLDITGSVFKVDIWVIWSDRMTHVNNYISILSRRRLMMLCFACSSFCFELQSLDNILLRFGFGGCGMVV